MPTPDPVAVGERLQRFSTFAQDVLHRRNPLANSKASDKIRIAREKQDDHVAQTKTAKLYYVSGNVQGVGYRYFAQRVAVRLELPGYVKNLGDGRVEVYVIGTQAQLLALKQELQRGPGAATVTEVTEEEAAMEEKYMHDFSIEHNTW